MSPTQRLELLELEAELQRREFAASVGFVRATPARALLVPLAVGVLKFSALRRFGWVGAGLLVTRMLGGLFKKQR